MEITGHLLIGSRSQFGSGGEFQGINAASGEPIEPVFGGASPNDVDEACRLAEAAFDTYRETGLDTRLTSWSKLPLTSWTWARR